VNDRPDSTTLIVTGRAGARILRRSMRALDADDVAIVTPADLSHAGWGHDPHAPQGDSLAIAGSVYSTACLRGVLTAIDCVQPHDLPHVHPDDQTFVGQEMTAFLRSWLDTLPCPVLDQPTPIALSGPAGDPGAWASAAEAAGVSDRRWEPWSRLKGRSVTVVGGRAVRPGSDAVTAAALALVDGVKATAAHLTFIDDGDTPALVQAGPWWLRPSTPTMAALLAFWSVAR
jgi:hypothetical protein